LDFNIKNEPSDHNQEWDYWCFKMFLIKIN